MRKIIIIVAVAALAISCDRNLNKADAYGNFEADEINIAGEIPGKVVYLNFQEGSEVTKGQVLAMVDTTQLFLSKMSIKSKRAAIASKSSNVVAQVDVIAEQINVVETEISRVEELIKGKAAPTKQLDDLKGKISVLEKQKRSIEVQNSAVFNELKAVDYQIKALNDKITRCAILSPIEGTVLFKSVSIGEVINPSKTLGSIANTNPLILKAFVSGDQLDNIQINQTVEVQFDKTKEENNALPGKIIWISSKSEFAPKIVQTKEDRVNMVYAIKIEVENSGALKIGMPGEVYFN